MRSMPSELYSVVLGYSVLAIHTGRGLPITVSVEMRRVIWFLSIYVKIGGY